MITRDYPHLDPSSENAGKGGQSPTSKLFDMVIKYHDREILAVQRRIHTTDPMYTGAQRYVVVPGYVTKYQYRKDSKTDADVSEVVLVESKDERDEISDLIKGIGDLEGNVYFW